MQVDFVSFNFIMFFKLLTKNIFIIFQIFSRSVVLVEGNIFSLRSPFTATTIFYIYSNQEEKNTKIVVFFILIPCKIQKVEQEDLKRTIYEKRKL